MNRTVNIDGREVRFRASAAIPRMYRMKFRRDIIQDMKIIQTEIQKSEKERTAAPGGVEEAGSSIPLEALTLFENVAYLMARHADPADVPGSVEEWLDGFGTFSIYQVFPVIQELWEENLMTLDSPKKK